MSIEETGDFATHLRQRFQESFVAMPRRYLVEEAVRQVESAMANPGDPVADPMLALIKLIIIQHKELLDINEALWWERNELHQRVKVLEEKNGA